MKLPQGPKSPALLQNIQLMGDFLGYLEELGKRYGDIYTMHFMGRPTVFVSNPEGIKKIFTNTKEITASGELNKLTAPVAGSEGIMVLDGLRHKHMRKLLMPGFHGSTIQAYGERICELTQKVMNEQAIAKPFLAYPVLEVLTLQVVLEVTLGLHEGKRYQQLRQAIPSVLEFAESPLGEIIVSFPFLQRNLGRWSPWGYFLHQKQQLNQLLYAEINERRQKAAPGSANILSELIAARDEVGESLTDQVIHDLLLAPIYAGRDAAASAIAWSLYWIHYLPAVRDRLLAELDSLGDSPSPMNIVELPYLSAVCNEALRLYPTQVLTFPRRVESPVELMGYELSPGTVLVGNIYQMHQREDLYPAPKEFKPERFLEKKFSPYEFIPFGGGARGCLGAPLVLFEMKLVLATILLHYQLAIANQESVKPQRRSINFPPTSLKMVMLDRRQIQDQTQRFATGSVNK
jgi:cytochrome P450